VTKNEQENTYNLNELLELQNKLMLMSSKGEHGRDQVNKFTQVGSIITIVHQHFAKCCNIKLTMSENINPNKEQIQ